MKEIKRVLALLFCLPLLAALPLHAQSKDLDVNETGSITISIPQNLQETDVAFSLYQIAKINQKEDGSYSFEPAGSFSSGFHINEEKLETENFRKYVSDYIEKNNVQPDQTSGLVQGKESFCFKDIPLGIYYVRETQLEKDGKYEMTPFLITVPFISQDGYVTDVDASTKYQFNTLTPDDTDKTPKEPSKDVSLPKESATTDTNEKTPGKSQIPFSGTYMYLLPVFCGAGLFLLAVGFFLCFSVKKEL